MYGGTTWEDLEYPWILNIPDTVCLGRYWGTTREDPKYPLLVRVKGHT